MCILIIDSNPPALTMSVAAFERAGLDVISAENLEVGRHFIEFWPIEMIGLVLCNREKDESEAFSLIKEARKRYCSAAIFLSIGKEPPTARLRKQLRIHPLRTSWPTGVLVNRVERLIDFKPAHSASNDRRPSERHHQNRKPIEPASRYY